jgi:hypothetical protein
VPHILDPSTDARLERRVGSTEGLARRVAELERRLGFRKSPVTWPDPEFVSFVSSADIGAIGSSFQLYPNTNTALVLKAGWRVFAVGYAYLNTNGAGTAIGFFGRSSAAGGAVNTWYLELGGRTTGSVPVSVPATMAFTVPEGGDGTWNFGLFATSSGGGGNAYGGSRTAGYYAIFKS